jgi:hypothetical protein
MANERPDPVGRVVSVDYLSNRLTVTGARRDVGRARRLLEAGADVFGAPVGFAAILPLPVPAGLASHETAMAAWGCGGVPMAIRVVEDDACVYSVTFDTVEGAPAPVARALSARVPGVEVLLECVWAPDPGVASVSGTWKDGAGSLAPVPATREHFVRVRPETEAWELDGLFAPHPRGS